MGASWYTGVNPSTPVYTINFNGLQERYAAFGVLSSRGTGGCGHYYTSLLEVDNFLGFSGSSRGRAAMSAPLISSPNRILFSNGDQIATKSGRTFNSTGLPPWQR